MKTLLVIFALSLSISSFGQSSSDYALMTMQAGTAKLAGGKTTIALDENTLSALSAKNGGESYYVQLTPIGNCGALKLNEKGDNSFTVSAMGSGPDNGSFDYIIIIKYHPVSINQVSKPYYILPAGTSK